ncbi:MAG TPA: hypothetical protein VK524_18720 [Polyangiaceae bacterium]|nr:hypothetical protein [Polyangiaceae bacterium]
MNDHVSASADPSETGGYSHPDRPVRHSYPLAIEDAGLSTAIGLLMKTLPYALARFGILLTVSVVTIIWFAVTFGGLALLAAKVHPWAGYAWLFMGMGLYGYLWRTLVRYFLYLLKAGHIAVLTELITRGSIGSSREGMFDYGKRVVTERFGQVNVMFALDLLVHGVVRAFNRTLNWIANLLPIPGLQSVTAVVNAVVYSATTFIDETIFSYALARGDTDNVRSSRDGLIYYAQNSKEVLKTGVWIVILDKVATGLTWMVMLIPGLIVSWILPASVAGPGGLLTFVVSALLAWNVRAAFLEPLFLTMVMVKFHVCVRDQAIDLIWDERLSSVSGKFVQLKNQVTGATRRPAAVQAQPSV